MPGFDRHLGPLGLAAATIYVPTRRSARALAATFAERIGATATFLPRILPLGALDSLEPGLLFDEPGLEGDPAAELPVAIGDMARRMILTRLILAWGQSVRHAIVAVDADGQRETLSGEVLLVATSAADAWHLSGELAALLDELVIEDVAWQAMKPLGTENFDRYWAITLDFLGIAMEQWPQILAARGEVDPATRQASLIAAEIERLQRVTPEGPVIVAGASGANAAVCRLMAAVAGLRVGAVVLPGLDQHLDEVAWEAIDPTSFAAGSAAGHAQAAFRRLLPVLGIARADVVALGSVPAALTARSILVSEALRPADTTDAWRAITTGETVLDAPAALDGVALIEAADEREEALALAIALRETLEGPDTAVLVTPDRTLARRVREELTRWGIVIDDSGGEALAQTTAGALARLALDCPHRDHGPVALLALLAHPAVRLGRPRAVVERLSRLLERAVLRTVHPAHAFRDPLALLAEARARSKEEHAGLLKHITEADFTELDALVTDLMDALASLSRLGAGVPLPDWIAAHEDAVAGLTRTDEGASALKGADATVLATLFDDLIASADAAITLDCSGYAALFDRIAAEAPVRGPERSHPRLKILGLLEARLLHGDRILLGGLDEAIWPPQVRTDAFLNRPMRAALGLTPPERRIGASAHDFTMALGQKTVIISRAAKRGGSPTVPSRFLQRLAAVAADPWDACRARGDAYLDLARALDRPARTVTIPRPAPTPPVELRPTKLSVTRVEMLRRDPYAIYADHILRLKPLDPIGAEMGPREWGTLFHEVLSGFIADFRRGVLPEAATETLLARTREAFAEVAEDPQFQAFMAPRLARWVRGFLDWERARRDQTATIHVEARGTLELTLADGSPFTLTAHADRIETDHAGALHLVDYKTGRAPSKKEVQAGFAPQLTLEAAIAAKGGFPDLGTGEAVDEALYVKFSTGDTLAVTKLVWKDRDFADVVAEHLEGLVALLDGFRNAGTGYLARPYPQFQARYNDYDHLSRVKEWSATGGSGDGDEGGGE